jgi:UDP-glucose 6-dehydrogenase
MMVRKIRAALGGSIAGKRIGVLGLAFKANTDDMRDAPALTIVPQLIAEALRLKLTTRRRLTRRARSCRIWRSRPMLNPQWRTPMRW